MRELSIYCCVIPKVVMLELFMISVQVYIFIRGQMISEGNVIYYSC